MGRGLRLFFLLISYRILFYLNDIINIDKDYFFDRLMLNIDSF